MLKGGTVRNRDHGAMNFFLNYRKIAVKQLLFQCCFGVTKQFLIAKLCRLNPKLRISHTDLLENARPCGAPVPPLRSKGPGDWRKGVCLRFFCRSIAGVSTADMSDLVGDRPSFSGRAKDKIVVKDEIESPFCRTTQSLADSDMKSSGDNQRSWHSAGWNRPEWCRCN